MDKVALTQAKLSLLDDPQVELHLLRSYLSSCKIIHLLRTVPFTILKPSLLEISLFTRVVYISPVYGTINCLLF